ncbi:TPA: hypothetical protein ACSP2M_004375, partial [Aeromonas hydrophila]
RSYANVGFRTPLDCVIFLTAEFSQALGKLLPVAASLLPQTAVGPAGSPHGRAFQPCSQMSWGIHNFWHDVCKCWDECRQFGGTIKKGRKTGLKMSICSGEYDQA